MELPNANVKSMAKDFLYHFGMEKVASDLKSKFSDVKFVFIGGPVNRMQDLANLFKDRLKLALPETNLEDLTGHAHRYSMFKIGPIICVNHGIGIPSMIIMLHELLKLLCHAGCSDVTIIRIGTSGGLGIEPGTVVISDSAVDEEINPNWRPTILGQRECRPCVFDANLLQELKLIGEAKEFPVVIGKTLTTLDFYEGQARLDGAICNYSEEDKMAYLKKMKDFGVVNIEMECLAFGAFCHLCRVKGAVINVTLVDRFAACQITIAKETYLSWQQRPQELAVEFVRRRLGL